MDGARCADVRIGRDDTRSGLLLVADDPQSDNTVCRIEGPC